MRVENRKRVAWHSFLSLLGAWALLLSGVFIEAIVRGEASDWWLLLVACLSVLIGLHTIYFRHEMSEVFEEPGKRRLWLWPTIGATYGPKFFLTNGIAWLVTGGAVLAKILL